MKHFKYIIFLVILLFSTQLVYAAINTENLTGPEDLAASISPKYPGPRESVTIKVQNYLTDIERANIRWFLDGQISKEGVGENSYTFTLSDAGKSSLVKVIVNKSEGGTLSKSFSFTPQEVDILWEALTYSPIFYKGRSLPSPESTVKATAVVNFLSQSGKKFSSKDLLYEWDLDGVPLISQSGYNKDTILFTAARSGNTKVSVVVSTLDRTLVSKIDKNIKTNKPVTVFYEESPLLGTKYAAAINQGASFNSDELTLRAEPYFFNSTEVIGNKLSYNWKINDEEVISGSENKRLITLRPTASTLSRARINLRIENLASILQVAKHELTINFGF